MCKAPKPPAVKEPKKPEFLRNRYLDEYVGDAQAVKSLKTGRSQLRIPTGVQAIGGRQIGESLVPAMAIPAPPAAGPNRPPPISGRGRPTQTR